MTLTDLQEAERTFSRSRAERQAQEQPGQKPVGTGGLQGHTGQHEPPAEPTAEAGESRQPRGQGSDVEVSSLRRALDWAGGRRGVPPSGTSRTVRVSVGSSPRTLCTGL